MHALQIVRALRICLLLIAGLPAMGLEPPNRALPPLAASPRDPMPNKAFESAWERHQDWIDYYGRHHQQLSDAQRVRVLLFAAIQNAKGGTYDQFGSGSAFAHYLVHGPVRECVELGIKAARGAENVDTLILREMHQRMAMLLDPAIGLLTFLDHRESLITLNVDSITLLATPGRLHTPGEVTGANPYTFEPRSVGFGDQPRNTNRIPSKQEQLNAFEEELDRLLHPSNLRARLTKAAEVFDWEFEWDLSGTGLDRVKAWLEEHEVPALSSLPYQMPHDIYHHSAFIKHTSLDDLHAARVTDFVGERGFGISRMMAFERRYRYKSWVVERTRLVSFYERYEPVVYQHDPIRPQNSFINALTDRGIETTMAALRKGQTVPSRKATTAERRALTASLDSKQPVRLESDEDRLIFIAPILAKSRCARCHNIAKGEPLGAFLYELGIANSSKNHVMTVAAP